MQRNVLSILLPVAIGVGERCLGSFSRLKRILLKQTLKVSENIGGAKGIKTSEDHGVRSDEVIVEVIWQ